MRLQSNVTNASRKDPNSPARSLIRVRRIPARRRSYNGTSRPPARLPARGHPTSGTTPAPPDNPRPTCHPPTPPARGVPPPTSRAAGDAYPRKAFYSSILRLPQRAVITHCDDLVLTIAAGCFHHRHVALFLANQGPGNGRAHRNPALLDVRFEIADDLVTHFVAGLLLDQIHR